MPTITQIAALLAQIAMLCTPTPATEVLTLYHDMITDGREYIQQKLIYIQDKEICYGDYYEEYWFIFDDKKIFCPDIVDHFVEKRNEIGNKAMRFSGLCQEFFGTSDTRECVTKAYSQQPK